MVTEKVVESAGRTRWLGRLLVGAAVSLLALWLLSRNVRWADVGAALQGLDVPLLLLAVAMATVNYALIALRWHLLFAPQQDRPARHALFSYLMIAQLANAVLPLRLSPLIRAYLAAREGGSSKAYALSTIAVEKVLDGLMFSLILLALLPFVLLPDWLRSAGWPIGLTFFGMFAIMLVSAWQKAVLLRLLDRLFARYGGGIGRRLLRMIESTAQVLDVWHDRRLSLWLGVSSLLVWLSTAATYALTMAALHIQAPPVVPFVLVVVLQAGVRVPSLPANIGVFHYLSALVLTTFLVPQGQAVTYALVLHAISFVYPALLGVLYLGRQSVSLERLVRLS